MEYLLAILIGLLYAGALYMMMRRHLVRLIVGLALLSHGANLLIFTSAGLSRAAPPILPEAGTAAAMVDPLPQALVLTAIVISFGVLAFALVLFHRTYQSTGTDDIDQLHTTER